MPEYDCRLRTGQPSARPEVGPTGPVRSGSSNRRRRGTTTSRLRSRRSGSTARVRRSWPARCNWFLRRCVEGHRRLASRRSNGRSVCSSSQCANPAPSRPPQTLQRSTLRPGRTALLVGTAPDRDDRPPPGESGRPPTPLGHPGISPGRCTFRSWVSSGKRIRPGQQGWTQVLAWSVSPACQSCVHTGGLSPVLRLCQPRGGCWSDCLSALTAGRDVGLPCVRLSVWSPFRPCSGDVVVGGQCPQLGGQGVAFVGQGGALEQSRLGGVLRVRR